MYFLYQIYKYNNINFQYWNIKMFIFLSNLKREKNSKIIQFSLNSLQYRIILLNLIEGDTWKFIDTGMDDVSSTLFSQNTTSPCWYIVFGVNRIAKLHISNLFTNNTHHPLYTIWPKESLSNNDPERKIGWNVFVS